MIVICAVGGAICDAVLWWWTPYGVICDTCWRHRPRPA